MHNDYKKELNKLIELTTAKIDSYTANIESLKNQGRSDIANELQSRVDTLERERESFRRKLDLDTALIGKDLITEAQKGNIPTPKPKAMKFDVIEAARAGVQHG